VAGAEQEIAELEAALAERDGRIAKLEGELLKLAKQVASLQEQLSANSSNSSKPPSSDRGKNPHRNAKKGQRSGKKRGGQKGHRGHHRELVPEDEVDAIHDVYPEVCECCGEPVTYLSGREPTRHQVTELPEKLARTEEWRRHFGFCPNGHESRAPLPEGVPSGAFGPRLVAAVGLLTGMYRVSKRNTRQLLRELFGVEISEATISNCERRISDALRIPHQRLHAHVKRARVVHADETSWRESNEGRWLWVACTSMVAFFLVQARRTGDCAKKLLGAGARAVLVTDRLGSYDWWPGLRQVCWAHIKRTLQGLADAEEGTCAHRYGTELLKCTRQMFDWWHRVRDGTLARSTFRRHMKSLRAEFEELLDDAAVCGCTKTQGKAKALIDDWDALWVFVDVEGVEPTNNQAERDLRHGVIMRKLTFGTQSERGSRFVERILSTVETLRKQDRDVMPFLQDALGAHEGVGQLPSLLPTAA
jgi:transposase